MIALSAPGFAQSTKAPATDNVAAVGAGDIGPHAHPVTEDQVREYLSLTGVSRSSHTLMSQMVSGMRTTAAPYYPAAFWDDMAAEFLKIDLVSIYVPIYQRYLSEEDMATVLIFYRGPSGQKLLNVQSMLVRDAQVQLRELGGKIGLAVYAKHKDEIEAARKKYEANQAAPDKK